MPILARTEENYFPGSITRFYNVTAPECTNFISTQALALYLQGAGIATKGCTIIGGQGMTDAPLATILVDCEAI